MMFIRSKIMRWGLSQFYSFSIIKSAAIQNQLQAANPFRSKTYPEMTRLLSLQISHANELTMCNFIIKAVSQRIKKENSKFSKTNQKLDTEKQKIINKCLQKMLSKCDRLSPQQTLTIIKIFIQTYEIKSIRINQKNRQIYKYQIPEHIKTLLANDKQGKDAETIKKIFYLMLLGKKKVNVLKDILEYLKVKGLKTSEQQLQFFQKFNELNKLTGFLDATFQPLITKFILLKSNTIQNANIWVKPFIIQIFKKYLQTIKITNNTVVKKYFAGLQYLINNHKVSINEQIHYFKLLIDWSISVSLYLSKIEDNTQVTKLIYDILNKIDKQIGNSPPIDFNSYMFFIQCAASFDQFISNSSKILGKSQNQLRDQILKVYYKVFQSSFLHNFDNLSSEQITSVLNHDLKLNKQLESRLLKELIKHLEKNIDNENLILRMRLFEYATKSIVQNKFDNYRKPLQKLLRIIEKKSRNLKEYQMLRIYNVMRILNIKSPVFQQFIKFHQNKNEEQIIENVSRTILKNYSYNIIQENLSRLFKKLQKQNFNNDSDLGLKISKSIWYIFKSIIFEDKIDNIDPLFILLFKEKYYVIQNFFKNSSNLEKIMSIAIKESNRHIKNSHNSISYEILLEILNTWRLQNPNADQQQYKVLFAENLKALNQSENVRLIFYRNYRYSFFVKTIWSYYLFTDTKVMKQNYYKKTRQTKQITGLLKKTKTNLYRQKPSIKNMMLFRNVECMDILQDMKMKHTEDIIRFWFWSNYNKMNWRPKLDDWVIESLKKTIEKQEGVIFAIQFILGVNEKCVTSQQLLTLYEHSKIPKQLYQGNMTQQTTIDKEIILNLFALPHTLVCLLRKNEKQCNLLIQKISQLKNIHFPYKLLQISNIFESVKQLLTKQTKLKFKQWVEQSLKSFGDLKQNKSLTQIYIKLNINSQQYKQMIDKYIKDELGLANFFIAQVLYINGYDGIAKQMQKLFKFTEGNRVLFYLQDKFESQYILLFNSFLGLSLHQKDENLVNECVDLFLRNVVDLQKLVNMSKNEEKNELYLLNQVAKSRIQSSSQKYKTLDNLSVKLKQNNANIQSELLSQITQKNKVQLKKQNAQFEIDQSTNLPKHNGSYIIYDCAQPGYYSLIKEYYIKCLKIGNVKVVDANGLYKL